MTLTPDIALCSFDLVTPSEVISLLRSVAPKTMCFDPIPTWLVKSLDITLAPIICRIVNVSLTTGILPTSEKKAAITPVLKKPGLDANVLLNYRPISCLTFLSKFIERVVFNRINTYISHFSLPGM